METTGTGLWMGKCGFLGTRDKGARGSQGESETCTCENTVCANCVREQMCADVCMCRCVGMYVSIHEDLWPCVQVYEHACEQV